MGKEGLHPDSKQKKFFSMLSDEEVGHLEKAVNSFSPSEEQGAGTAPGM